MIKLFLSHLVIAGSTFEEKAEGNWSFLADLLKFLGYIKIKYELQEFQ